MPDASVSRRVTLRRAFVMTEKELKRLSEECQQFTGTVTYEVRCSDGLTRTLDLGQLLNYENPPSRQIEEIEIKCDVGPNNVSIEFRSDFENYSGNICVAIHGPESAVVKLDRFIEDILLPAMAPGYDRIAEIQLFSGFGGCVSFPLMIGVGSYCQWLLPKHDISGLVLGAGATYLVLGFLNILRVILCPMNVFAIGQGTKRHEKMGFWRSSIVVALILGIIASLIAAGIGRAANGN